ncbi:phage portal protein [Lysinibacillus telephonicus]|uniref:phage portal protein n=1 Tax=Lysinibacillus telephonicus TaxID=1714840 RepID=UPI003BA0E333
MKQNILDRAIGWVSPKTALKRAQHRVKSELLNAIGEGKGYGQHGASTTKRSLQGWISTAGSALEDIERNIPKLRERSRDLFMGAPLATGSLRTIVTNTVGAGLKLNSQIDRDVLKMSQEESDAWESLVEREFQLWAESENCDSARMCDFYQLQQLAFLSMLMSGDVFATLPYKKRTGSPYELTIQLIEADRVCNPGGIDTYLDAKVINGVEIDMTGEIIAYHIADKHPKSIEGFNNNWTRVEKFGKLTGRRNVLHILEMERPEQRRGVPILAPVMEALKQLDRYTDAELMAAVISGMYTLFVTTDLSDIDDFDGGIDEDDEVDREDDTSIEVGNGAVNFLKEGEKIQESNPGRPNTAFDGFVTAICRQIGVALEIPYEVLMKHFTSSYSASRGALLEAWKMFKRRRHFISSKFCQPIYEEFLTEAIARGRIYAPGFFDDPIIRKAYCRAEWNGPTQGQLDPKKEVEAAELRVKGGFSTRTRESIELTGTDFYRNHEHRVREETLRKEAGLIDENTSTPIDTREGVEQDED